MSARQAAGRAVQTRASAAGGTADALSALRFTWRSMIQPAPIGQASACKPPQRQPAVRWLFATAALARTVRWPFPEVARSSCAASAARGSRASTDPRKPRILFNPVEGLSMEKPASPLLRAPSKFVPLDEIRRYLTTILLTSRKSLINRMYTLCEVTDWERQPVPPRETALSGPENSPVLGLPFDLADGRQKPRSGSSDGKKSGAYLRLRLSNTSPFSLKLTLRPVTRRAMPCAAWISGRPLQVRQTDVSCIPSAKHLFCGFDRRATDGKRGIFENGGPDPRRHESTGRHRPSCRQVATAQAWRALGVGVPASGPSGWQNLLPYVREVSPASDVRQGGYGFAHRVHDVPARCRVVGQLHRWRLEVQSVAVALPLSCALAGGAA